MRAELIRSLKKGNQHTVSFDKVSKTEKMFIEANPQFKTINIYSPATKGLRRETLRQESATAQAHKGAASPRPGAKDKKEWKEEENEEQEEVKEEEAGVIASKQPARRKVP